MHTWRATHGSPLRATMGPTSPIHCVHRGLHQSTLAKPTNEPRNILGLPVLQALIANAPSATRNRSIASAKTSPITRWAVDPENPHATQG